MRFLLVFPTSHSYTFYIFVLIRTDLAPLQIRLILGITILHNVSSFPPHGGTIKEMQSSDAEKPIFASQNDLYTVRQVKRKALSTRYVSSFFVFFSRLHVAENKDIIYSSRGFTMDVHGHCSLTP